MCYTFLGICRDVKSFVLKYPCDQIIRFKLSTKYMVTLPVEYT